MKLLFSVLATILCGCLATKEVEEDYAKLLSSKLLQEIEKRLNEESLTGGLKPDQCTYSTNKSTIIRTQASIHAGAKFISPEDVTTKEECVSQCCKNEACDLAVFKEQMEHACYLFTCDNHCQFTSHRGFTSVFINSHHAAAAVPPPPAGGKDEESQHESELKSLATDHSQSSSEQSSGVTHPPPPPMVTTTRAPSTTTYIVTTTKATPKPTQVKTGKTLAPLFGTCHTSDDCAGSVTMCLAGYCVCKDGFHEQEGICHHNVGKVKDNQKIPATKQTISDHHLQHGHEASMKNPLSHGSSTKDTDEHSENLKPPTEPSQDKGDKSVKDDKVENTSNDKSSQSNEDKDDQHEHEPNTDNSSDNDSAQSNSTPRPKNEQPNSTNASKPVAAVQAAISNDANQIAKEEAGYDYSFDMPSNQGAVVALALGLAITAVMLVWVGCRLRTVKKRLRRGRALNSNEADYLINGMYL